MAKNDIKGLLGKSKTALGKDHQTFVKSIGAELDSFKKKTLSKI